MAVKGYYGTCNTAASTQDKIVIVKDLALQDDDFTFNIGDFLIVYFTDTNLVDTPSLVIQDDDTEEEVSVSDDTGKKIKTLSIHTDAIIGAWEKGETVTFVYTANLTEQDINYYWELINAAPSTESVYGVTKLFGNSDTSISEWLNQDDTDDYETALTPGILKKFYKLLIGDEKERPGESIPIIQLNWIPETDGTHELTPLGRLSLSTDPNGGVEINYPLMQVIQEAIGSLPETVTRTSQLINDGEDPDPEKGNSREDGKFYLTNYLPDGKSLYYNYPTGTGDEGHYEFLTPGDTAGILTLRGRNGINIATDSGININAGRPNGKVTISPGLVVDGSLITLGPASTGSLTTSGMINAQNNEIKGGQISALSQFKEGNLFLKDKYSGQLLVEVKDYNSITIDKNTHSGHLYLNISKTGYTPIGIVGFNLNYANANSTGDATWCFLWECHKYNADTIEFSVRNTKTSKVKINARFNILYVKNI